MLTPIILIGLAVVVFFVVKKKKATSVELPTERSSGVGVSVGGGQGESAIVETPHDTTEELI
jgi:plastocyanin domain-containing protein